jgi:hypothetical protein
MSLVVHCRWEEITIDNSLPGTKLWNHGVTVDLKDNDDSMHTVYVENDKRIAIVANENLATSMRKTKGKMKRN